MQNSSVLVDERTAVEPASPPAPTSSPTSTATMASFNGGVRPSRSRSLSRNPLMSGRPSLREDPLHEVLHVCLVVGLGVLVVLLRGEVGDELGLRIWLSLVLGGRFLERRAFLLGRDCVALHAAALLH